MMMVQDFLVDNDSNGIIDNDSNDIKDYDNFAAQAPWQSWWPNRLMWSRFVTDENSFLGQFYIEVILRLNGHFLGSIVSFQNKSHKFVKSCFHEICPGANAGGWQ